MISKHQQMTRSMVKKKKKITKHTWKDVPLILAYSDNNVFCIHPEQSGKRKILKKVLQFFLRHYCELRQAVAWVSQRHLLYQGKANYNLLRTPIKKQAKLAAESCFLIMQENLQVFFISSLKADFQ